MYITRHDHYGKQKSKADPELNNEFQGPKVILYDMWRAHGWDILSQAGFVTHIHHDAAGFVTGLYPRSGAKLWSFFYIKKEHMPAKCDDLFTLYDGLFDVEEFAESVGFGTVPIEEGDFL
jgi:hypothetical protein